MRRFARKADSLWQSAEVGLIVLCLAGILFLGAAQIVLRNFASSGWIWADVLIRHLVLIAGFLGASAAAAQRRHITIDAVSRFLKGPLKRAARILTCAATAVVAVILAVAACQLVRMEREAGGSPIAGWLPVWAAQAVIPYAFASVAVRSVLDIFSPKEDES